MLLSTKKTRKLFDKLMQCNKDSRKKNKSSKKKLLILKDELKTLNTLSNLTIELLTIKQIDV